MLIAKIIKPLGNEEAIELPEDSTLKYKLVSETVGGAVAQHNLKNGKIMYFNEDGKMLGLDPNLKATSLAKGIISPNDYILGNVIIL
jgi:hypothetical protein